MVKARDRHAEDIVQVGQPARPLTPWIRALLASTVLGTTDAVLQLALAASTALLRSFADGYGGLAIGGARFARRELTTAIAYAAVLVIVGACTFIVGASHSRRWLFVTEAFVVGSLVYYVLLIAADDVRFADTPTYYLFLVGACAVHIAIAVRAWRSFGGFPTAPRECPSSHT